MFVIIFTGFARILIGDDLRPTINNNRTAENLMNAGDDAFFDVFPPENFEATVSPSGLVNSVPSALSRWTVESRLLDGSSLHDCVNALKPDIIKHLEKLQMVEIQEKIAEEKAKKEENAKKKAAAATLAANAAVSTTESSSTTTSSETTTTSLSSNTTTAMSSTTPTTTVTLTTTTESSTAIESTPFAPSSTRREAASPSGRLVSTRLTTQDFPVLERESNEGGSGAEQMDTSPSFNEDDQPPPLAATSTTTSRPPLNEFETPFNPIPDFVPNAPGRDGPPTTQDGSVTTPAPVASSTSSRQPLDSSQPMSAILAVSPSRASAMETPRDLPRMSPLRSDNQSALTGGLGFTPQIPVASAINTPQSRSSELPSVAEILATPADIPSLQQLRSGSLFSQGSPHLASSLPPNVRQNVTSRGIAPSPLSIETGGAGSTPLASNSSTSSGTSSVVAADLAAAIMSQLVTSSPTPSIATTANTTDSK